MRLHERRVLALRAQRHLPRPLEPMVGLEGAAAAGLQLQTPCPLHTPYQHQVMLAILLHGGQAPIHLEAVVLLLLRPKHLLGGRHRLLPRGHARRAGAVLTLRKGEGGGPPLGSGLIARALVPEVDDFFIVE